MDTQQTDDGLSKNTDSISLGGNIELQGFKALETAKQIVAKKIIGNHVRQIQEKKSDYERLKITFEGTEDNATIKIDLVVGGETMTEDDTKSNVFMAVDGAFKKIIEKL